MAITPLPVTTHLLVESRDEPGDGESPGATSRFLDAARSLAASGVPTIVFFIDEGVTCTVGPRADVAGLVAAGARLWADETSLAERRIASERLAGGTEVTGMDRVTSLFFDPSVRVVWH